MTPPQNVWSVETLGEDVTLHHRAVPVLEACTSPHTAPFLGRHVAAVFAFEGFSKLREVLEGSQDSAGHEDVIDGPMRVNGKCS